jgi:hypothetical protein
VVAAAEERAHQPGTDRAWEESWYFDFVAAAGVVAGFARLGIRPSERRAWWWSAVVGRDQPLILVRDHDVPLPRRGSLEIRTSGLWAEPVCETPLEHWSLGLEAFAVALEDPADAFASERGDPVPLGFDLEWETTGPPAPLNRPEAHYGQACAVSGDVLVGQDRVVVNGTGTREHAWGPRRWWEDSWTWLAGCLDDGTTVGIGDDSDPALDVDAHGLITGGRLGSLAVEAYRHAPVQVPSDDGRVSRLARALCRLKSEDGRSGWAWAERLQPA